MRAMPAPHRVLQLIQAPQHRGAEVFAVQLSTALRARDWQSTVMSLYPGDERFVEAARAATVWGGVIGRQRTPAVLSWSLLREVAGAIEAGRYPIVQANGAATLKYLATARLMRGRRWRLIYRTIGMPSYWHQDPLRAAAYRWWFRQADLVVAVCERAGEELVSHVGLAPRRITVIPNGVDARAFLNGASGARARLRAEAGTGPDDVVVAHVGSFSAEKNHGTLVRAAAALRAAGVPLRLWLVGDGPARGAVEAMVRDTRLADRAWLPGVRPDIADVLAAADLLVLPSLTEGMPAVVIEAGLSRLPVVAFNVGGIDEVVQDGRTGLLVAAGDESALQAAMTRLARDAGLRRTMGEAAREACLAYDIGRIAARYADTYDRVLAAAGS
ncbi:MAG: glycosyltransferase family 4 protein [Armatimonadota bacterium]|nr:glycosyltransferase family 4 protein [Armatimonadota bacterium]